MDILEKRVVKKRTPLIKSYYYPKTKQQGR